MGILDKVKEKAEQLLDEAKGKFGQMTGNESHEGSGSHDSGHDPRDEAAGAVDDAKDKTSDDNK